MSENTQAEIEEFEDFDDDYEGDFEDQIIIRAKWSMDGAKTLAEAAQQLRGFADYIDSLKEEGLELISPIEDDYGFLTKESK